MSRISELLTPPQLGDRRYELLSKKEVVIDVFDGFFGTQLLDRPMALSRLAEINVLASTLASKKIWKKRKCLSLSNFIFQAQNSLIMEGN